MPVRLSGYQPQYFPRLHYFARILDADIFKISDYVQFVRTHTYLRDDGSKERGPSYQVHTPIKQANGLYLLTVPTEHHGLLPINRTVIEYSSKWPHKHLKTIEFAYRKTKHGAKIITQLSQLLATRYLSVAQLNITTILWALAWILGEPDLPLHTLTVDRINELLVSKSHPFRLKRIVVVSQTDILPHGDSEDSTDWIIDSCRRLGADEYYHGGTAATAYLDFQRLTQAGIRHVQQDWTCQRYQQLFPKAGFISNLSIIDLLMNEDLERVREVLSGAKSPRVDS